MLVTRTRPGISLLRRATQVVGFFVTVWAWLTVGGTFVLLALGATVTTFRVGMADPVWPTTPWHLFFIDWREPSAGFLIEHSHRLAGYIVGCMVIILVLCLAAKVALRWATEGSLANDGWLALFAATTLLAVIIQGLLGGYRVRLHELLGTNLAVIHGSFAQIVFAILVCLAVFCSSRRTKASPASQRGMDWFSLALVAALVVQVVLGALLRHTLAPVWQRLHVLMAFVVVAGLIWLVRQIWIGSSRRPMRVGAVLLSLLIVAQLVLGVEAWVVRFGSGELPELQQITIHQAAVRTAHVLIGALILATASALAVSNLRERTENQLASSASRALEEAA